MEVWKKKLACVHVHACLRLRSRIAMLAHGMTLSCMTSRRVMQDKERSSICVLASAMPTERWNTGTPSTASRGNTQNHGGRCTVVVAAVLLLWSNPARAFQLGFQLSFSDPLFFVVVCFGRSLAWAVGRLCQWASLVVACEIIGCVVFSHASRV